MKLLLAEDDPVLADGLMQALQETGYTLENVQNGSDALHLLLHFSYDAAILDLGLPGLDGLEILKQLRDQRNRTPVLILTARDTLQDRIAGLNLGADDYMAKPFNLLELEARLRALLRRAHFAHAQEIQFQGFRFDTEGRRLFKGTQPIELSARELDLLELLVVQRGRVVSKAKFVESLCGWEEEMTLNAIEVYISRLRKKLEPLGLQFRTIKGIGYLLEAENA